MNLPCIPFLPAHFIAFMHQFLVWDPNVEGEDEAGTTRGGQRRIPKTEIERLKRDGLPSVPRPLPGDNPRPAGAKARQSERELPDYASEETIEAADEVVRLEAEVRSLGLKRQKEEALDWFRRREREEANEEAAQEEDERLRLAAEEAQRMREQWLQDSEAYALDSLPARVPPDIRLELHQAVRERLARLHPMPSPQVTEQLVDSVVEKALAGWRRMNEIKEILLEARDSLLPYDARGKFDELTDWQIRVVREAGAAIGQLRDAAPVETIRAVAKKAVEKVATEFEHQRLSEEIASQAWLSLHDETSEERQQSRELVTQALAQLPVGTTRKQMEGVRDAALQPIRDTIAQRQTQQQIEQRRQQDRAVRQTVLASVGWRLPWSFPDDQKKLALETVSKVIAELPEGTLKPQLEQTRDQALQPFLDAHTHRKRKAELIDNGLRGIHSYLLNLEEDWDFEGKTTSSLESEIKEPIRVRLEEELAGDESPERVEKRVMRMVREELDIEPRRVAVAR